MKIEIYTTWNIFELLPRISFQKDFIAFEWLFWSLLVNY